MKKKFLSPSDVRFAFFGTPALAVTVLDALDIAGFLPALVVTRPDAEQGRGNVLTPPKVKTWVSTQNIPILQPAKITPEFVAELAREEWDLFIVAAYGKILPQALLDIPARGTLNLHPSLLPKLRGPSPIRSAILNDDRETGVSIMLLDAEMDHGPIVAQEKIKVAEWPPKASDLENALARAGGNLLAKTLLPWMREEISAQEQDHERATYCKTTSKEDGLLDLAADPYQNLLKIRGLQGWPGTYTFFMRGEQKIRVQILDARVEGSKLVIYAVRPEGKRDMKYADFLRSGAIPA
jgi:methionyl-tRNA formyltransferase